MTIIERDRWVGEWALRARRSSKSGIMRTPLSSLAKQIMNALLRNNADGKILDPKLRRMVALASAARQTAGVAADRSIATARAVVMAALAFAVLLTAAVAVLFGRAMEYTIVEREKANLAITRADVMEHDKAALEREIAERHLVERELAFTASHDELTGLANRTLFMRELDQILAHTESSDHRWAILFIDLDRFKVINDSLGHAMGDLVLIETARRLGACLRSGDTLARLGGDEFIILLGAIEDVDDACQIAQRLLRAFDAPFTIAGHEVSASASIGIATCANREEHPDDVLRNADIAMYRAKSLGKQRYALFAPEMLATAVRRMKLESDLARALERREFCLFYQPLVAMRSGSLVGFEALVRWRHPANGMVNPNDFIPLAEETGVIIPLGEWILYEACRQLKDWQITLPGASELRMNINVSGKQLESPNFIATIEGALATTGLGPERINLEITESVLLHDAEDVRETLRRIRKLGIQIHLDDFGTGYSSLSYLRDFPIDAVKIDRSFVSTAENGAATGLASVDIVRSIIALANSMSLTVTAEGIETAAQVDELRDLGCTNMQGFHFSRPIEAVAAAAMIASAATASTRPSHPSLR
jgi:diguanylate cyclase (GGDEF)-like protein